ncbi:DUF3757 domain-containing protein [Pseudomonas sp. Marseille-Q1929]|uniref:DUF3757 domain-containing protein n=1 Tax=Pseudomonas sp. Marseille-Q1929 TaxID=2730402 RepID=UPI001A8D987B|nr:DUF3757 domain-containing protein [Pseudomonas sp. Marseille-Q1929]MBO0495387.1 DUF3757 domain-containing protein [Pseudomonas sp. Marseille-Q1929]
MPTFRSFSPSLATAVRAALYPAVLAGLVACTSSDNAPSVANMCPGIGSIHQTKEAQGYSYSAIAPGSGWHGENPLAEEHYLKGMKFESAAIRTGQASPGQPEYYFVACDYEGPEQFAFLRMSQRFPVLPRGTGANWDEGNVCRRASVTDCPFTVFGPAP